MPGKPSRDSLLPITRHVAFLPGFYQRKNCGSVANFSFSCTSVVSVIIRVFIPLALISSDIKQFISGSSKRTAT